MMNNPINREIRKRTVFGSHSAKKTYLVLGIVTALYTALNAVGAIMGVRNLDVINSLVTVPLILGIAGLTFKLRQRMVAGSANHTLWTGMALGAAFWGIAEFWWAIGTLSGSGIPYPSGADFFWLIAYIPMAYALWIRVRSLPRNPNPLWKRGIWGVSLLIVALTVAFILLPIIQTYDPSALLESILGLLYPLADLGILLLTLWVLSTYQQGMYGKAWTWIAGGFTLIATSDLFFAYSATAGLYYPDGQVNLMSVLLIDVPYTLGYMGWLVGLLVLRALLDRYQPLTHGDAHFDLVPDTHFFIATGEDNAVISVSQNMLRLFPVGNQSTRRSLTRVLGLAEDTCDEMVTTLKTQGVLRERPIKVTTRSGPQEVLCSGIAVLNPQKEYSGASLLVRMLMQDHSLDMLLSNEEHNMIRYIGNKSGVLQNEQEEIKRLLTRYHLTYLKVLYNRSFSEGGAIIADALLAELLDTARQQAWPVTLHPETLLDVSALTLPAAQAALPLLVATGKRFVARITDAPTADAVMQEVQLQIDNAVHKNVLRHS